MATKYPRKTKYNVCGRTVAVTEYAHGGGHIYPTASWDAFKYGKLGKDAAAKLTQGLYSKRPPRPGYEVNLCDEWWLSNHAGKYELRPKK
jgi:hypothetical protein